MPNLSQRLINALCENKTETSLVIAGSPDFGELLEEPFEEALLKGFKENISTTRICCNDGSKKTMEMLASVISRLPNAEKFESIAFNAVHFDSLSFFLVNISTRTFPFNQLGLINLESDAINLLKPILIEKSEGVSFALRKPTHLYIANLDKPSIDSVAKILLNSKCRVRTLAVENIAAAVMPDLIAVFKMLLRGNIEIHIGSLELPVLDMVCKEILANNLKFASVKLPEKSELDSVNKLRAEYSEAKKRKFGSMTRMGAQPTQLLKKQAVPSPLQPSLSPGPGVFPQFFSSAETDTAPLLSGMGSMAAAPLHVAAKKP